MAGPLQGIRVVDMTRVLSGPWGTRNLGDMGAEIIKIENPKGGDEVRTFAGPTIGGDTAYFVGLNRNKKSVAIDFTKPAGREALLSLIESADVVIENFRSGVLERYGLGFEDMKKVNPSIIFCSVSGYGRSGPFKDRPGYDPIAQGETGFMSLTGEPDGTPYRTGVSVIDIFTGMYAAQAILGALIERGRDNRAQRVETSLFDTGVDVLSHAASGYLADGTITGRPGNGNLVAVPAGMFHAADGPMMVALTNDRQWRRFCEEVIDRPDWIDHERFGRNADRVTHRDELTEEMNAVFARGSRDSWIERMRLASIPAGPVRDVAEALTSPEAEAREILMTLEHRIAGEYGAVRPPARFPDREERDHTAAPVLGQHTVEVLSEIGGYSLDDIDELAAEGIVAIAPA